MADLDPHTLHLSPADARALDALADAGFELSAVPPELPQDLLDRAARLSELFSLADAPAIGGVALLDAADPGSRDQARLLVDVTMARVQRQQGDLVGRIVPTDDASQSPGAESRALEAIDELVDSGWRGREAPASSIAGLLGLLNAESPSEAGARMQRREAVVEATLSRVQRAIDAEDRRLRVANEPVTMVRGRFRMADLIAIAATLLIGTAVVGPMLLGARETVREQQCAVNFQNAGLGFGLFASQHDGRLPSVRALPRRDHDADTADGPWWNVGTGPSHSANLFVLVRTGYVLMSDLSCPGNHFAPASPAEGDARDWRNHAEVSYSLQLFSPDQPPRWNNGSRLVILTDKSPVVERARRGESFDSMAPSRNHQGRGQNVLFNDGSVNFMRTPVLGNGDNIWLPASVSGKARPTLTGREVPTREGDAFVGP